MTTARKRAIAGAGTVILAGAVNVATGVVTQHWALAWWITTAVLVLLGGGLQAWLTASDGPASRQVIKGTDGLANRQVVDGNKVRGSIRQVMNGPGEQSVTASEAGGDLTQHQLIPGPVRPVAARERPTLISNTGSFEELGGDENRGPRPDGERA
jgi:hypothetical protein